MKKIKITKVNKCPICDSIKIQKYTYGYDYEINSSSNLWVFYRCFKCSCIFLNPRPKDTELDIIYPENYYSFDYEKSISSIAVYGKYILDKFKFSKIIKQTNIINNYLDIGCGSGRYLYFFNKFGLNKKNIYGIDFNTKAIDKLKKNNFNNVQSSTIENYKVKNKFSLITLFHVLEHTSNPKSVVNKIHDLLEENGTLVIETPNTKSLDHKLFKNKWWGGYHIPRHWVLFNQENIKILLSKKFVIKSIFYTTGHSFWLYSFHHLLKYNSLITLPKLANFFHPHKNIFLLILFTMFDFIRAKLGFKTSSMVIIAKKN